MQLGRQVPLTGFLQFFSINPRVESTAVQTTASHSPGFSMTLSRLPVREQFASLWGLGGLTWRQFAKRVWRETGRNDLINRAYELAFNFLLAIFPMFFFLFALLGLFVSERGVLRSNLLSYLHLALPPSAYQVVVQTVHEITGNAVAGKMTFGLLFALYAGSAGMTQLMSTLNSAYDVREERSWVKVHLISAGVTLAMAILVVAALVLILLGGHGIAYAGNFVGMNQAALVVAKVLEWVAALAFVVLAFAIVYYFAPNVEEQHWYWITPGSVIGMILWAAASAGLRIYLHFFNTFTRTYGSLGAVIILMMWFYVAGLAVLIGGQVNATIEQAAAERGHVEAKERGRKAA
ncbi:MAG TPA: YihY/virulence factor BrkB family protein [Candidatus Sulfotelmatobacter sp.]|nr:YihY/virulence factor BrkB family protein [Candidatus Sulfotelmatobacter sp.]